MGEMELGAWIFSSSSQRHSSSEVIAMAGPKTLQVAMLPGGRAACAYPARGYWGSRSVRHSTPLALARQWVEQRFRDAQIFAAGSTTFEGWRPTSCDNPNLLRSKEFSIKKQL